MVKDHSDSERGNPAATWQQGFFYMRHPTARIAHTTAFVTPVVEHRLEWEIWYDEDSCMYYWVHGIVEDPLLLRIAYEVHY